MPPQVYLQRARSTSAVLVCALRSAAYLLWRKADQSMVSAHAGRTLLKRMKQVAVERQSGLGTLPLSCHEPSGPPCGAVLGHAILRSEAGLGERSDPEAPAVRCGNAAVAAWAAGQKTFWAAAPPRDAE
jgi:hypothetical protein